MNSHGLDQEKKNNKDFSALLVHLYDSKKLYDLVNDDKPMARAELARAVTDLFSAKITPKEQEMVTDIMISMIRQAETELKQALAEKLAKLDTVPLRLVLHLANDSIDIAAPVLRDSAVLSDLDLLYIIKAHGAPYWRTIAGRPDMRPEVVDALADTKDVETAVVLTRNERVALTGYAVTILGEMAKQHDVVARPLVARPEVPKTLVKEIYRHVGQEVKAYIMSIIEEDDFMAEAVTEKTIVAFEESTEAKGQDSCSEFMPTERTMQRVRAKAEAGILNWNVMLDSLSKGDIRSFIAGFSLYTGIPVQKVHDFMRQPCPKGLAIACRAFYMQKGDFSRIYLLSHRMRSRDRFVNQQDLMDILSYFEKVKPESARKIVSKSTQVQLI